MYKYMHSLDNRPVSIISNFLKIVHISVLIELTMSVCGGQDFITRLAPICNTVQLGSKSLICTILQRMKSGGWECDMQKEYPLILQKHERNLGTYGLTQGQFTLFSRDGGNESTWHAGEEQQKKPISQRYNRVKWLLSYKITNLFCKYSITSEFVQDHWFYHSFFLITFRTHSKHDVL